MGIPTNKRPPLPAPTESLTGENSGPEADSGTDVSKRSDRSHYSLPEDGSPITISTKNIKAEKLEGLKKNSQTSLLIEYYEGEKSTEKGDSRPSVRVKVTPRANKSQASGDVKSSESATGRKPSYTRRISLDDSSIEGAQIRRNTSSNRPPVDVEVMHNPSEAGSEERTRAVPPSDISSMPTDSMIGTAPAIKTPTKGRSANQIDLEEMEAESNAKEGLKPPELGRSRSKSKERITRKAIEKLTRDQALETLEPSSSRAPRVKSRPKSRDLAEEDVKSSKRSSRRESGTESSLLKPKDQDSNISSGSKVSLNNPKLYQTITDAINQLIMPEIRELKRQQSARSSGRYERSSNRDSYVTESSVSKDMDRHHSGKSSGSHRPRSSRTREELEALESSGKHRRRRRHHSHDGASEQSSRRDSVDSVTREKERIKKRREGSRSVSDGASGLTTAALRSHDSQTSKDSTDSYERRQHEKRKRRSKRDSQTDSIANTEEEYYTKKNIPSMPMASEMQDSDLTRESILSAETAETERPQSSSSRTLEPAIREVTRGSPQTVSPSHPRTPSKDSPRNRDAVESSRDARPGVSSKLSDRSISSKAKSAALAAAGMGAAAGAMYGHDKVRESGRRSVSNESARTRERVSSAEKRDTKSRDTLKSAGSVEYPTTQKRHTGINLEKQQDVLGEPEVDNEELPDDDPDRFYEDQHEVNNQYRHSRELDEQDLPEGLRNIEDHSYDESLNAPVIEKAAAGQQLQDVGANPELRGTPPMPESRVASLIDPGPTSSQSGQSGSAPSLSRKPDVEGLANVREAQQQSPTPAQRSLGQHDNASAERWNAIKSQAARLSNESFAREKTSFDSPRQSAAPSIKSEDQVHLGASGIPGVGSPMPEVGHGLDAQSDVTTPSRQPSILEGPLGDADENQGRWPYEPTTPGSLRRDGFVGTDQDGFNDVSAGTAGLTGAAAGLGIGAVATERQRSGQSSDSLRQHGSQSSASLDDYANNRRYDRSAKDLTPAHLRDEGYVSAIPARSEDAGSPLSFSKPPPQLFREGDPLPRSSAASKEDTYAPQNKHIRQLSGNSHGLPADSYEAATGRGINNIKSQDVVALMDHLTVRDGQRNARDTEILVTLVRSAAEMRSSFDGMKKFIENQNNMTVNKTTSHAESTASRILANSKSQASGSTRGIRTVSAEREDAPTKRRNIFQRALKGLGSRNEKDLSRMEEMLTQLLDEVEELKEMQSSGGSQRPPMTQQGSLTSYERLRAAPDSGYEPEGQAGTGSTPSHSGNFTVSPGGRSAQRMHSGYEMNRDSGNRISTVMERDEDENGDLDYENDDGMLTPTQEAYQQRSGAFDNSPANKNLQFSPNTPKTGDSKGRQKSISSSLFGIPGIPKISRWSKTTASTNPGDRGGFESDRPYSGVSRSGSDINVLPGQDGEYYEPADDDRFRTGNSFERDDYDADITPRRSPSPLIPDADQVSLEDPKYQANRHSLPLQHPQPRAGPTNRHQSHLESAAYAYAPNNHLSSNHQQYERSSNGGESPDNDAFGSVPSLARNRFSSGSQHKASTSNNRRTLSPISSDGGYSANSGDANIYQAEATRQYAPPRPPKIKDQGPLVPSGPARPPKVPHDPPQSQPASRGGQLQQQQQYSSEDYSPSSLTSSRSHSQQRSASASRSISQDVSPSPSREAPRSHPTHADPDSDTDPDPEDESYDDGAYPLPIPLDRKKSPYSPGGLLAPIEERYSLEQSRLSTPLQDDRSVTSRQDEDYTPPPEEFEDDDDDDDDRAATPVASPPRAALNAGRKVSGPREMPGRGNRVVSAGAVGGRGVSGTGTGQNMATQAAQAALEGRGNAVRGTVRRKPAPYRGGGGAEGDYDDE
ncbi:MAG: hypothetical protein M1828_007646 [Chrysothrix sp. TS-e1954]|nr:MAG: hypothetical protein M1828_007646 [Chrysothrix sp. TS-e1954]